MSTKDDDSGANMVLSGVRWIFIINVAQRLITFVLNQLMISFTSPEIFGLAAISFELLLSTLLFLSREGIRLACLREEIISPNQRQLVVNVRAVSDLDFSVDFRVNSATIYCSTLQISWVPSIILVAVLLLLSVFQLEIKAFFSVSRDLEFSVVMMYCAGALLENMGEPWVNTFQSATLYGPRLKASTIAIFVRSAVTFVTVVYFSMGIRGFGYAQMAHGATLFLTLALYSDSFTVNDVPSKMIDFLPRMISPAKFSSSHSKPPRRFYEIILGNRLIDLRTAQIALSATISSLLKHLLTEADKIALSLTSSSHNQGVFAVSNNYGSLVARMIFFPIEESSRTAFSKLATKTMGLKGSNEDEISLMKSAPAYDGNIVDNIHMQKDSAATSTTAGASDSDCDGETSVSISSETAARIELEDLLVQLVQVVSSIGVMFLVFGPLYSRVVVRLLFSKDYIGEDSVRTLAAVCVNVFVLALNGILEAFVHAAAPPSAFRTVNFGFVMGFIVYVLSLGPLIKALGTCGLVLSGSLSMIVRIFCSCHIILGVLEGTPDARRETIRCCGMAGKRIPGSVLRSLLFPPINLLIVVVCAWLFSYVSSQIYFTSERRLLDGVKHVSVGSVAAVILLIAILRSISRENLQFILRLIRPKDRVL